MAPVTWLPVLQLRTKCHRATAIGVVPSSSKRVAPMQDNDYVTRGNDILSVKAITLGAVLGPVQLLVAFTTENGQMKGLRGSTDTASSNTHRHTRHTVLVGHCSQMESSWLRCFKCPEGQGDLCQPAACSSSPSWSGPGPSCTYCQSHIAHLQALPSVAVLGRETTCY